METILQELKSKLMDYFIDRDLKLSVINLDTHYRLGNTIYAIFTVQSPHKTDYKYQVTKYKNSIRICVLE